jgi:hypothetical protein
MTCLEALGLSVKKWGDRAYARHHAGLCEIGVIDPGTAQFATKQQLVMKGRGESWEGAFESAAKTKAPGAR